MVQSRKLRRVTDLFVRGTTVDLTGDGTELVFVKKPNAFERGEADMDGRAARQLRMATLERDGNDRSSAIELAASRLSDGELLEGAITQEKNRAYLLAIDDVKADQKWFDRLEMLERTDQRIKDGVELSEEERAEFNQANADYIAAINASHEQRVADLKAEHAGQSHEDLVKEYVQVWVEMEGMAAFEEERWTTLLYYAVRDCVAKVAKGGRVEDVDHSKCTHPRLLDTKRDVRELPDEFRELVEPVLRESLMNQVEAGNSAAPTSSSGSSEQHDAEAESEPSTQKVG
jgi:hypothetical protein